MEKYSLNEMKAAVEFEVLCELIYDVADEFEGLKWTGRKELIYEIGFYNRDKKTNSSVFFGIWYESWRYNQIPLSIVVDYQGKWPRDKHLEIKKYVESIDDKGLIYKRLSRFCCGIN
jgi:hypothetical protein